MHSGCEYIDDGAYGRVPPSASMHVYRVPTSFVAQLADTEHLARIRVNEADYLNRLTQDIAERGICEPILIHHDSRGTMRLREGHHRLHAALLLDLQLMPARLRYVRTPMRKGIHVVAPELMDAHAFLARLAP